MDKVAWTEGQAPCPAEVKPLRKSKFSVFE